MILSALIVAWTIIIVVLALRAWKDERENILRVLRQTRGPMPGLDLQHRSGVFWFFYGIMEELEEQGVVRHFVTGPHCERGCRGQHWYELTEKAHADE